MGRRKAPEVTKNAPAEVARTGQGGAKSDSNPLAELAGTGQCGAGTDESRMTSGRIRRRGSRIQSGGTTKKERAGFNPVKITRKKKNCLLEK